MKWLLLLCALASTRPASAAEAPLDVKTVRTQKRGDVTMTELTYDAPKGQPVPAYLVTPRCWNCPRPTMASS